MANTDANTKANIDDWLDDDPYELDEDGLADDIIDDSDSGRAKKGSVGSSTQWLLSMTDMVTLMLTFFVFIFAQSVFFNADEITVEKRILSKKENLRFGQADYIYSADVKKAPLSLSAQYLYRIFQTQFEEDPMLKEAFLTQGPGWVMMSFPATIFFERGDSRLDYKAKLTLFAIADMLRNSANRIEVIGHSTPENFVQTPKRFPSNWHLSLARALEVFRVLRANGVRVPITAMGRSSTSFDANISRSLSPVVRDRLARRVDIVVYDEKQ